MLPEIGRIEWDRTPQRRVWSGQYMESSLTPRAIPMFPKGAGKARRRCPSSTWWGEMGREDAANASPDPFAQAALSVVRDGSIMRFDSKGA